jgi:lipid-A-disaccharide synthase
LTRILLTCGETSGDHQASLVVREIKRLNPESEVLALGGRELEEAGARVDYSIDRFAFMGFAEIIAGLPRILSLERKLKRLLKDGSIDLFLPVDYPGFNLRLAASARRYGVPVLYFISPQIWAWGGWRVRRMRRFIDLMTVIIPFEKEIYDRAGLPTLFVGHPGVGEIPAPDTPKEVPPADGDVTVLLFPGSRRQEVERMLPVLFGAARIMRSGIPRIRFVLGLAPLIEGDVIEVPSDLAGIVEVSGEGLGLLEGASLAIAASGTVTLQCALSGTPMVVLYKTSRATYCIGRRLVTIPWIAMPNVLAGKRLVPELIQDAATPEAIASQAIAILGDPERYRNLSDELLRLRVLLGGRGPRLVAEVALRMAGGEKVENILSTVETDHLP